MFVRIPPAPRMMARWIYLRILGFCFLATFVSLLFQILGLIGSHGIFPAAEFLSQTGFWKAPSLLWLNSSDAALLAVCWLGLAGAVLVVANRRNRIGLVLCWACFLSLTATAPHFAWYKADGLLLEAAFLAWFLAPKGAKPGLGEGDPPSRVALLAHLWLLFRLMIETGLAKIFSTDPVWRMLDAMEYFHETMPYPTWVGWLFGQLPYAFHRAETAFTLAVECVAPFFLLFGRRPRFWSLLAWCALQVGILLSGNFLAFNYHAIGLALLFLGDASFARWSFSRKEAAHAAVLLPHTAVTFALLLSLPFFPALKMPEPVSRILDAMAPFRSANQYVLFPFIDRERMVVILEGSEDGTAWREYGYRWQTQRTERSPSFLAPLSNRFEHEMQKVLEGPDTLSYRENPFVFRLASRLLEGSADVSRLFGEDPFDGRRPQRIRAEIYRYAATDLKTLLKTGDWWTRTRVGDYCPVIARNPEDGRIDYAR